MILSTWDDPREAARRRLDVWQARLRTAPNLATIDGAEAAAREALVLMPLDNQPIRLTALAAEARGDKARAESLMEFAVRRAQSDYRAQAWLLNRSAELGHWDEAMQHLDAVFRVGPVLVPWLVPTVSVFISVKDGAAALVRLLEQGPPWRSTLLNLLASQAPDVRPIVPIVTRLISGPHPLTAGELNPVLARLVKDRMLSRAYLLWTQWLPPERLARLIPLFNGNFETTPTGAPFDWTINPIRGARIEIAASPLTAGEKALSIEFLDTRVPFQNVRHLLLLVPGSYQLRGRVLSSSLRTEGNLRWKITCMSPSDGPPLGTGLGADATAGWQNEILSFDVPATGCSAQWLVLELGYRTASEQRIAGRVWYEGLELVRMGAAGGQGRS